MEDLGDESEGTGTNTPAGEPSDDFFSSWDKPSIKRPSNPPSRTGTPGINRTASPFLSAGQNGAATSRPKSPLKTGESSETPATQPTATRAVSSTAVRKTTTASKPKSNILGAKKTKLGAKKVDAAALDFDEAEKKAREEAERKERLGYDPDEETPATPAENTVLASQPDTNASTIHQPTPLSPGRAGGFGSTGQSRQRSDSEMERLGMATKRLGFGQVGAPAAQKSAAPARGLGFGAVSKPVVQGKQNRLQSITINLPTNLCLDESQTFAREKFGTQKGISSDEFFGRNAYDPSTQNEARTRLQGFEGATSISSNAYFGRPEDEADDYSGDLEAAKDFVRKFGMTAGDDIENLTGLIGEGAQRLRGAVRDYLNG